MYMKAFWDLCDDRYQVGHKIPWTAVQKWCEANEIDREEHLDVHTLVTKLDITYLKWMQEKQKKPSRQRNATPIAPKRKHDARPVQ